MLITLAAQAETRAAVEVQATQWPFVTALVIKHADTDYESLNIELMLDHKKPQV